MRYSLRVGFFIGLFVTVIGERSQLCTHSLDGHLIVAKNGTIWKTNAEGENEVALANYTINYISLDYDVVRDIVYWNDWETHEVHSIKGDEVNGSKIAIPGLKNRLPLSIAVDPLANKLYMAEGLGNTVMMFDLENKDETGVVVVSTNLNQLKKILLDPYKGYLFILDGVQILRTDLDGENQKQIYARIDTAISILNDFPSELNFFKVLFEYGILSSGMSNEAISLPISVSDIALDYEERRVYWINMPKQRVESSDYEGKDVKTHYQERMGMWAGKISYNRDTDTWITLIDEYLYFSNNIFERVVKVDVNNATSNKIVFQNNKVQAIKGISCSAHRAIKNPCDEAKCQHRCIRSNSDEKRYRCACNFSYELAEDGIHCRPVQDFLLHTSRDDLRARTLNTTNVGLVDILNPTEYPIGHGSVLDYDAMNNTIFFTSNFPDNKLHQLKLDSGELTILKPDLISSDKIDRLAYDWTTGNIYYVTSFYMDATFLCVTNVKNPIYSKILLEKNFAESEHFGDLNVHPKKGYLFILQYVNSERKGIITRMAMDGSESKDILKLDVINSFTIDYDEDRIYWSVGQKISERKWKVSIRHSDLNGTNAEEYFVSDSKGAPKSMSVSGDYIYLVLQDSEKIVRFNKKNGSDLITLVNSLRPVEVDYVKVFNRTLQADNHKPCEKLNCDKLCLAVPDLTTGLSVGKCDCPYGEKLADNGTSCIDNSLNEPEFLPCEFESFLCKKSTVLKPWTTPDVVYYD